MPQEQEHVFDRIGRELADVGTSALNLGPNADMVFTVGDSKHRAGEKLLHTELITGEYHRTTLKLSSAPILPPDVEWAGGVYTAVCEVWGALGEAIDNFQLCRRVLDPVIPEDDEPAAEDGGE